MNALGYDGHTGVVVPLEICVIPGEGSVYLDSRNIYGVDFQKAVAAARDVFKHRHGNQGKSFLLRVRGVPEYLDGRSVALAVYAGIFAVSFDHDISNYAFTGGLGPDGSVLPVTHVNEKASAFDGPVVVPRANCMDGLICVSNVDQLERTITSKRV